MGEEKNGVQNGTPNGEMPPQEDSAKMPLTDGSGALVEVKATEPEAKIEIPEEVEFKGLTKDELMQYAKEPFWIRLRIFLMVLFWAGWLAMLVLAVLIIIQAPRCEPPPTISWLQESPILEMDISKTQPEDAVSLMTTLGLTSFYIPSLISGHDYYKLNPNYVSEFVIAMLQGVSGASMKAVTDFVPNPVQSFHPWVGNDSYSDALDGSTRTLNYSNTLLDTELQSVFRYWKTEYNVTGFLVSAEELKKYDDLRNLTASLNSALKSDDIVIGESAMDLASTLVNLNIPGNYKQFLQDTVDSEDWNYYKYNPMTENHSIPSPLLMPAVTLSLMLLPGTPILQLAEGSLSGNMTMLVQECVDFRQKDAIKFGETQFANTTDNVVAYTRTLKGTPGYAVAINLGLKEEVVDFTDLKFVPETGTLDYSLPMASDDEPVSTKPDMNAVTVAPHGGLVIQFVAKY